MAKRTKPSRKPTSVTSIADALAADNAKFQRARFLAACGMEAGR